MGVTRYKTSIAHADTNISNAGSGQTPASTNVLETSGGARTLTGSPQVITDERSTGELCNVGDIVKYVNLFIGAGPREASPVADRQGWLEWAFICVKESETAVPITDVGTMTLGTICRNMFRNECIYTGMMPIGRDQSNTMEMHIKIPKFKQKITLGDEWRFVTWFRSTLATSTENAAIRLVKSWMYKSYN